MQGLREPGGAGHLILDFVHESHVRLWDILAGVVPEELLHASQLVWEFCLR